VSRRGDNRLRVLRAERRLTQEKVALRLGVSQATFCQIENGNREPSLKELEKLARIFGVDWRDLGFELSEMVS